MFLFLYIHMYRLGSGRRFSCDSYANLTVKAKVLPIEVENSTSDYHCLKYLQPTMHFLSREEMFPGMFTSAPAPWYEAGGLGCQQQRQVFEFVVGFVKKVWTTGSTDVMLCKIPDRS